MSGNFKIKVNNEAESEEAQELFFELGYDWYDKRKTVKTLDEIALAVYENGYIYQLERGGDFLNHPNQEITLPKLRDLVVLNRNDANDATHEFASGSKVYVSSDDVCYEYIDSNWVMFTTGSNGVAMKPIKAEAEQGLINGVDAFNYKMAGEAVLWKMEGSDWQDWTDFTCWSKAALTGGKYSFKIKPKTVKIEIEIPAPFKPKDGEIFWFVSPYTYKGYDSKYFVDDCTGFLLNGVWRTEDEIKQVVSALRKGIKGVDNV